MNELVEAHNKEAKVVRSLRERIEKLEEEIRSLKPARKLTIPGVRDEQKDE